MKVDHLRENYDRSVWNMNEMLSNPIKQFEAWMKIAIEKKIPEPNAMVLSTVKSNLQPVSRVVLLKKIDNGFVFFTNYDSHKGKEMAQNPFVSLNFNWLSLQQQIRIEGKVEKIIEQESIDYYITRPRGSQIGAWVSPQSQKIENREELKLIQEGIESRFKDVDPLPKPNNWGGFRVVPQKIEFWQGQPSRLHDRVVYQLEEGKWSQIRLAP